MNSSKFQTYRCTNYMPKNTDAEDADSNMKWKDYSFRSLRDRVLVIVYNGDCRRY